MAVPPGVSSAAFSTALKQFAGAVGDEWAFTSDENVALYGDAYSPFKGEPEERNGSQSNFGVVTKMGFWLMPEPDAYFTGTVTVPRRDDLGPLVDVLNYLENTNVLNGMPQLGSPLQALQALYHGRKPALRERRTDLTPEIVEFCVRHGVTVMPFFRKTEIGDADLDALAQYLAH